MSHAGIPNSGPPEGSQRKKRIDQETVIRVAVRLFNQHGYDRTSMNEIAAALGITKAALYYHFESKEDILLTGATQASERLDAVLDAAVAPDDSAREQVRGFVRAYNLALRDPTFRCLIQADERVLGSLGQAKIRECKRSKQHLLEDLLAETGAPRQDVRAIALAVFGALNWSATGVPEQSRNELDAVSDVVMAWLDQSMGML